MYYSEILNKVFLNYDDIYAIHEENGHSISSDDIVEINTPYTYSQTVFIVWVSVVGERDRILEVFGEEREASKYKENCESIDILNRFFINEYEVVKSKRHYYKEDSCLVIDDYNFENVECCDHCNVNNYDCNDNDEAILVLDNSGTELSMVFIPDDPCFVLRSRNTKKDYVYSEKEITNCPFCGRNLNESIKMALKVKF